MPIIFHHNSLVRIHDSYVEKYTPDPQEVGQKYAAIAQIAARFGFAAPRVLDVKTDHVVLERLHDITSLRSLYLSARRDDLDAAVRRAGQVLGHIHSHLHHAQATRWVQLPRFERDLRQYYREAPALAGLPQALLHCDYSFANVFFVAARPDALAVIDPCPNFASTFDVWTQGPIHLDLGKMLACLEGQVPARHQIRRPPRARTLKLQQIFLAGYAETACEVEERVAHAFAYATASSQFRRSHGALGAVHRIALYSRFLGNFPSNRKLPQAENL